MLYNTRLKNIVLIRMLFDGVSRTRIPRFIIVSSSSTEPTANKKIEEKSIFFKVKVIKPNFITFVVN